jgi:hypothetical protein
MENEGAQDAAPTTPDVPPWPRPDPQSTSVSSELQPTPHSSTQLGWRLRPGVAAGVVIALAGHLPASGLWLHNLYTFTFYAQPDSVFMVACLVAVLQLMLFLSCVPVGLSLYRTRHRDVGLGLLAGWGAGIFGLLAGTCLIAVMAAFL